MNKEFADLTPEQRREIAALAAMTDDEIDMSDIPEVLDWSQAQRGVFYRPERRESPAAPEAQSEGERRSA